MNEQEKANEKQLLIDLLKHPAAYSVSLEGSLEIRQFGPMAEEYCGKFGVDELSEDFNNDHSHKETIYDTVEEAVDKFLEIRYKRELGLDFWT